MKWRWERLFFWLAVFGIFWLRGWVVVDPDYGQHVVTGKLIWEEGIPKTDPFSYTMPDFSYVDHAWLADVLVYWGSRSMGMGGVAAAFAVLATGAVYVASRVGGKYFWLGATLALPALVGRGGVRPQVIDWLGVAIVLEVAVHKTWGKWRWMMPMVFTLWANLHGGWLAGLVVMGLVRMARWWEGRKVDWGDVGVGVLSGLGILINPYGWRLGWEVWQTLGDRELRQIISEWYPFWARVDWGFLATLGVGMPFVFRFWRKVDKARLVVAIILGLSGLGSLRNMALFVLAGMGLVGWGFIQFEEEAKERGAVARWQIVRNLVGVVGVGLSVLGIGLSGWRIRSGDFYPDGAIEYLKKNGVVENLMVDYNWGSYTLWKMPGYKLFVDGRMPSWRREGGEENTRAMEEYLRIMEGEKGWVDILDKYGVKTVVASPRKLAPQKYLINIVIGKKKEAKKWLGSRLEELGWERVYADGVAVVYIR